jgi:hypothetical protein
MRGPRKKGIVDTVAYYTTEEVNANIKKTMMVQPRGIKSNRGSLYFVDIRIIKSKAGYYCAAFDEHDVYDIIRPALALPMKRAVTMKAMTAEMAGEAMKTTYVSKIAKVVSSVMVQGGPKASSTNDGLTKDKLLKNKRNKVLSKKTSAACATKRANKIARGKLAKVEFKDELFKNERGKVKSVMSEIDIFTSMAGNFNIIPLTHMRMMKPVAGEIYIFLLACCVLIFPLDGACDACT